MLFIREFEVFESEGWYLAIPFGLEGGTQGRDFDDAVRMAADWLRLEALDALMRDGELPSAGIGNEAVHGGTTVVVAVDVSLDQVPAVTAAEAARMLGVSSARVAQLCNANLMDSWRVGGTRMVTLDSVEARLAEAPKAGRPRRELATV